MRCAAHFCANDCFEKCPHVLLQANESARTVLRAKTGLCRASRILQTRFLHAGAGMRSSSILASACLALLAFAPQASMAQVYKCSGKGSATYQDVPCKGAPKAAPYIVAPVMAPVSPNPQPAQVVEPSNPQITASATMPASPPTPAPASLRALYTSEQTVRAEQHRLETSYKQEREALIARMKNAPPEQAEVAVRQLNSKWVVLVQEAGQRADQIQQQIDQLCPGGALINAQEQTCNQ